MKIMLLQYESQFRRQTSKLSTKKCYKIKNNAIVNSTYNFRTTSSAIFQVIASYLSNWSCDTWWLAYERGDKLLNVPFQGRVLEITTRFNGTPAALHYGAVASRDP